MCWISLSQWTQWSPKSWMYTGFSFFRGVSGRGVHSFFHLCSARLLGSPTQRPSVTEHILSAMLTVSHFLSRTVYPIPTYHNTTCLSLLQCAQTHTTEPVFSLSSLTPLPPLVTPRRCLALYLVHPFSRPSPLVHMLQPFLFFILSIPTVPDC